MTPDWIATGKCQTRDGREVRIYATDGADGDHIHGAVLVGGSWEAVSWDLPDGSYYDNGVESKLDLIPIPQTERQTVFLWGHRARTQAEAVPLNITRDPDGKIIKVELAE